MPNRILHEKMVQSQTLDALSDRAERLGTRLIAVADDYGRFDADPRVLLAKCFPLKVGQWTPADMEGLRAELARVGYIGLYQVGDRVYGYLCSWFEHQRRRASRPKYPDPDAPGTRRLEVAAANGSQSPPDAAARRESPQLAARARVSGVESRETGVESRETGAESTPLRSPEQPAPAGKGKSRKAKAGEPGTPGAEAFEAYAAAYLARHGAPPVRNHRVNSLFKQLAALLGEEAPAVAAFYVSHQGRLYVSAKHAVNLLVRDAEKLRTEWATGRTTTELEARETDRRQGTTDRYRRVVERFDKEDRHGDE